MKKLIHLQRRCSVAMLTVALAYVFWLAYALWQNHGLRADKQFLQQEIVRLRMELQAVNYTLDHPDKWLTNHETKK